MTAAEIVVALGGIATLLTVLGYVYRAGALGQRLAAMERRQETCVSTDSLAQQLSAAQERWADSAQSLSERSRDHEQRLRALEHSRPWPPDRPSAS